MTTYWAIGKTETGEKFRVSFDSKRDAREWASEQKLTIARFFISYTNMYVPVSKVDRDQMQLEG